MQSPHVASPFLAALRARHAATGVMALDHLEARATYEGALVFGLSAALNARIEAIRASIPCRAPEALLLAPHLTVLFLGRWPGAQLDEFRRALRTLSAKVEVVMNELGVFENAHAITSIHVRATAATEARALHDHAVEECRRAGWQPQTPFVGDAYLPHVTLVDGICEPFSRRRELTCAAPSFGTVALSDLHIIGKRIEEVS